MEKHWTNESTFNRWKGISTCALLILTFHHCLGGFVQIYTHTHTHSFHRLVDSSALFLWAAASQTFSSSPTAPVALEQIDWISTGTWTLFLQVIHSSHVSVPVESLSLHKVSFSPRCFFPIGLFLLLLLRLPRSDYYLAWLRLHLIWPGWGFATKPRRNVVGIRVCLPTAHTHTCMTARVSAPVSSRLARSIGHKTSWLHAKMCSSFASPWVTRSNIL